MSEEKEPIRKYIEDACAAHYEHDRNGEPHIVYFEMIWNTVLELERRFAAKDKEVELLKEELNRWQDSTCRLEKRAETAEAEVARLQADLSIALASKLVVPSHPTETFDKVLDVARENHALRSRLSAAMKALGDYGDHIGRCAVAKDDNPDSPCGCGLDKALAEAEGA